MTAPQLGRCKEQIKSGCDPQRGSERRMTQKQRLQHESIRKNGAEISQEFSTQQPKRAAGALRQSGREEQGVRRAGRQQQCNKCCFEGEW